MMTVKNKWNGKLYVIIQEKDGKVTLQREDGSTFTISKGEYFSNYSEKNS